MFLLLYAQADANTAISQQIKADDRAKSETHTLQQIDRKPKHLGSRKEPTASSHQITQDAEKLVSQNSEACQFWPTYHSLDFPSYTPLFARPSQHLTHGLDTDTAILQKEWQGMTFKVYLQN